MKTPLVKTKAEVIKDVKKSIEKDFQMSFNQFRKKVLSTVSKDGSSDRFKSNNGYSVFYTTNDNYAQGIKNGYGRGLYVSLQYCGYSKQIKLSD